MNILNNLKYEIIYKNVININMRIRKDGILSVSAPFKTSVEYIEALVQKNYEKFYKAQIITFNNLMQLSNSGVNNDYIYIMGIRHSFTKIKDTKFSYSIKEGIVKLYYRNLDNDYERMVRTIAKSRFNLIGKQVSCEMNLSNIEIEERKFSKCFGKNYGKERIALNYLLVHLEDKYIKHVIYHEYAHCIEFNHSKKFYEVLSNYDNKHKENKKYIEQNLYKFC
ncbi:MAG: YgjP-like metallopeptidase domain-containing protein [Bacilli bacterium]